MEQANPAATSLLGEQGYHAGRRKKEKGENNKNDAKMSKIMKTKYK